MTYTLIRSNRRTIAIEIKDEGLIVRAPFRAREKEIEAFVRSKEAWIEKHLKKAEEQKKAAEALAPFTEDEIKALEKKAREYIPERVNFYAPQVGVTCGRITIRSQRTRWGSCSTKGNLNFNCLLMCMPPEVIDSVVVHELCHLKEMNHSARFYKEVMRVFPEYRKWDRWLKEHGGVLMRKIAENQ